MDGRPTAGATDEESRVWRALNVRPDERSRVLWASSLFFIVLAGASIGLNAADALFFLRNGVETLPWMIVFSGLVVMVVTVAYAAGLAGLGARTWSWMMATLLAVWLAIERVGIGLDTPGVYPAVWLTGQVVVYLGFTLLWDVAGDLVDTRQAKRLFPLFTSAGIAGAVVGNAMTGPLAGLLGTENLLVVQAAGLAAAGLVARITAQRFLRRKVEKSPGILRDLGAGLGGTLRIPLFRLVAGVGAVMSVLFFMVFFPFSEAAAESFTTEEALAGFLGLFSSLATAATFVVSLFFANRLFTKVGVVAVLLLTAIVYVVGFSTWLVSFGLFTATLFRGVQWVAVNALAVTAFSSLFNVLTGRTRAQVRDFVSAVPMQLGTVIAGAVLLLGSGLSQGRRTLISLTFAVIMLGLVVRMRRAYSAALVEAVRLGLSSVFTASMRGIRQSHHDADVLSALASGVRDPDPARRRVTAAILEDIGGDAAESGLREMLDDGDEGVRLAALRSLAGLRSVSVDIDALGLAADPSPRVRRLAASLLTRAQATSPVVQRALEDDDVQVRAHAARIVGGHRGRRAIEEMLASPDPDTVAVALQCVTVDPALAHVDARRFADHSDARVRAAAAEMLAGRRDSVRTLRALLDDEASQVRSAAARALTAVDRSALHDVLEHGSVRSREAALQSLIEEDGYDEYLHAWAATEIDRAAELHRFRDVIAARLDGTSPAAEYLVRVLERRERMVERWVVTALSTEETRAALPLVARGAISGDAEVKADALEAIESLTDRALARRLVALLEDPDGGGPVDRVEALQDLASDSEYWLRALASRALFEELVHDLAEASENARADDSIVVQTAVPPYELSTEHSDDRMTVLDMVLALQEASIFEHLDPEELEALARLSREQLFEPNRVVYEQGSAGDEMLIVVEGSVVVRILDGDDYRVITERGPGEPLGELGVLRRADRMAQMVAGSEGLHAIVISADDFMQLLTELPTMATALMAQLAERIAGAVDPSGGRGAPRTE